MFSVIIPLYNKADYILKAVDSVLNQSFQEFELIIVNDGSTDDSLEKIKIRPDNRIRVINQQNSGVSTTRNNGVAYATQEFIAFLDADDWWDPTFLEEMNKLIKDFPQAGLYGSKYYWYKSGIKKVSINHEPNNFRGYINYIKAYSTAWWMPLASSAVVIPRMNFIESSGFETRLKFGEDFDLWIRMALKFKIAYINKPLSYYYQDANAKNRALGLDKYWKTDEHFIFNLDYLRQEEEKNSELKNLLDELRLLTLVSFRINKWHCREVAAILSGIDFNQHSAYYKRIYHWPVWLVKKYFFIKKIGSLIKQSLIKLTR